MKRFVLTALAVLGVSAALAVTASSTADQARGAGMTGVAVAGLVVLLEVVNITGTWVWLTDTREHVRWEAAAGVAVASIVTGTCGLLSYGLIGAVAPAGLLFAVHLTFRLNQPDQSTRHQVEDARDRVGVELEEEQPTPAAPVELPTEVSTAVHEPVDPPTEPIPVAAPPTPRPTTPSPPAKPSTVPSPPTPGELGPSVEERAAQIIAAAGEKPSEGQLHAALEAEGYSVTRYRVKKLLGNTTGRRRDRQLEAVS